MKSYHFIRSLFSYHHLVLKLLLFLTFISLSHSLFSENISAAKQYTNKQNDVLIIVPKKIRPYQTIVNQIQNELKKKRKGVQIKILSLDSAGFSSRELLNNKKLVITLGAKSLDYYLSTGINTPFIASFITDSAFLKLTSKFKRQIRAGHNFVAGISLEQPIYRLTSLVKILNAKTQSVGVILGPTTRYKRGESEKQVKRLGSVLHLAQIGVNDNPVNKLRHLFQNSDVVIVVPDKASFNRNIARWVVTFSYKYKVPVISYSKKYADAGALISLYSKPQQIGTQTANAALSYLRYPKIRPLKLTAPKFFQITINQSVNQAFGLKLPAKEVFIRQLYKTEP